MNKNFNITATFLSTLLFAGGVFADNMGQDADSDMLYGHGMVQSKPGIPYLGPDVVVNELQEDLLYNPGLNAHAHVVTPLDGVASRDNHDDSDSLLHTSEGS